MRFLRKLKRTTRQYIIVAIICIVVIGTAAVVTSIAMIGQIRQEYEYKLSEAKQTMNDNKRTVFVALSDIETGDILTEDMVEERVVFSSQPGETFITRDDLGKSVIIDIPTGTHLTKSMVAKTEVSSILREVEYDVIYISSNIEPNDVVDIRIIYPNGESFIVLSKKQLKGYQPEMHVCYLWVDEEELLRMSAAIVDAGLYAGSRLFMTKYIEPNIQDASVITYTPSISILKLIEHDPNIVNRCSQILNIEVRKALENRLSESLDLNVEDIYWDIGDDIRYMPEVGGGKTSESLMKSNDTYDKSTEIRDNLNENGTESITNKTVNVTEVKTESEINTTVNITEKEAKEETVKIIYEPTETDENENNEAGKTEIDTTKQPYIFYNPELGNTYDINYFISTEG